MAYNEADTRSKLIDPKLYAGGWTEDLIKREETAGAIETVNGSPRKRSRGRVDYARRVKVNADNQLVKSDEDTRTPEELLDLIEARGRD